MSTKVLAVILSVMVGAIAGSRISSRHPLACDSVKACLAVANVKQAELEQADAALGRAWLLEHPEILSN